MGNDSDVTKLSQEEIRSQLAAYYPYYKRSAEFLYGHIHLSAYDWEDMMHEAMEDCIVHGVGNSRTLTHVITLNMRRMGASTYRDRRLMYSKVANESMSVDDVFEELGHPSLDCPSLNSCFLDSFSVDLTLALNMLTKHEAYAFKRNVIDQEPDSVVAEEMGNTRQRVNRLVRLAKGKLVNYLQQYNITD